MPSQDMRATAPAAAGRERTAADVMAPIPWTCSAFSTVLEATLIFRERDCGAVPVLEAGKPVGVVTERHVARAVPEHRDLAGRPVSLIMSLGVVAVRPDDPLDVVAEKFGDRATHFLLVIGADGVCVGIIDRDDLPSCLPEVGGPEDAAELAQFALES